MSGEPNVGWETYVADANETPLELLVGSVAYVAVLLAIVFALITRPRRLDEDAVGRKNHGNDKQSSNTTKSPHEDDDEDEDDDDDLNHQLGAANSQDFSPAAAAAATGINSSQQHQEQGDDVSEDILLAAGARVPPSSSFSKKQPPRTNSSSSARKSSFSNGRRSSSKSSSKAKEAVSEVEMSTLGKSQKQSPDNHRLPHHDGAIASTVASSTVTTTTLPHTVSGLSDVNKPAAGASADAYDNNNPATTPPQQTSQQQQQQQAEFPRPLRSWDLMSNSAMRFRHGHFSGHSVKRLVQQERYAAEISGESSSHSRSQRGGGGGGGSSWGSRPSAAGIGGGPPPPPSRMSESAERILESQTVEGEAEYYRKRYVQRSAAQRRASFRNTGSGATPSNNNNNHGNDSAATPNNTFSSQQQGQAPQPGQPAQMLSSSNNSSRRFPFLRSGGGPSAPPSVISRTSSGRSRMPRLSPDEVSPQDAADAFDPGVAFDDGDSLPNRTMLDDDEYHIAEVGASYTFCGNLLDLAEPDVEVRRIGYLAFPSTLGAMAEPFFRLGMVAIISHFIDADSMVAFVLVILFVRITTEELSGAITDAESSMLNQALGMGGDAGFFLAGRHVQLAVLMQIIFAVPILVGWALVMDPVVSWLVPENDRVGKLASEYTNIIVIEYAMQAASRTFMLVFHLTGQAGFELHVDLIGTAVTIASVAMMSTLANKPTLEWIGWIQVVIGCLKIVVKVAIVVFKGLLEPYRQGLVGTFSLSDRQAVWAFVGTTLPLLLGSLIELREWEILVLFIRHLGGAEVATWALMGIMWEIFEASTEGLGEAAAVRVSLILSEDLPDLARQLAHKSVLLGIILSMVVTSIFLMLGRNLSVALTTDSTIQHMFNDLVGITGVANIAMSLSQVYWSLLGSQGRFGAASSAILLCRWLLTMPLASGFIFGADYDLRSVSSALAVGYMTSTLVLAWRLFQSDWKAYAQLAREELGPKDNLEDVGLLDGDSDDEEDDDGDDDSFDDDSSDSTGFG